jgi:hypothetical protein
MSDRAAADDPICLFLTCIYAYPELLYIQQACWKRFLKQNFQFLVVDDSEDPSVAPEIKAICSELGYIYLRCPAHSGIRGSSPSFRHAAALNYGWKAALRYLEETPSIQYIGTLDTDLFPVSPIDIEAEFETAYDCVAAQAKAESVVHLWPGFALFRKDQEGVIRIEEIRWDLVEGTDTGGATSLYLSNTEQPVRVSFVDFHLGIHREEFLNHARESLPAPLISFCEEDIRVASTYSARWFSDCLVTRRRSVLFHLRNVSNWSQNSVEYQFYRMVRFETAIRAVLALGPSP